MSANLDAALLGGGEHGARSGGGAEECGDRLDLHGAVTPPWRDHRWLDEIQLEGQQSDDQIDEVWAYFKGGWGQIRFGDDDDASEQLHYLIPTASNIFGVDTPYFEFANNHAGFTNGVFQTNSTILDISSDATKIIYFSPTFAGFSFAASTSFLIFSRRRTTRFRLIWCLDLSPFNLDI